MKKISEYLKSVKWIIIFILLTMPIYAYLTFYMIYPVVCIIPIGIFSYVGLIYIVYSFLIGVGIGIFLEYAEHGFVVLMVASLSGYILAIVYQAFPAYLYGYTIYLSDIIVFRFIMYSWFLLFFYIIIGLIGLLIGGFLRDKIDEAEAVEIKV